LYIKTPKKSNEIFLKRDAFWRSMRSASIYLCRFWLFYAKMDRQSDGFGKKTCFGSFAKIYSGGVL